MISQVLRYLNNYFERTIESFDEIVNDGVIGSFNEYYVAGMYVFINNSRLNDGVYKIASATTSKLTFEETNLIAEKDPSVLYSVYGLSIPPEVLSIITEIESYTPSDGVTNESIDDYSVGYTGDGSWQSVYSTKLSRYKKVYNRIGDIRVRKIL